MGELGRARLPLRAAALLILFTDVAALFQVGTTVGALLLEGPAGPARQHARALQAIVHDLRELVERLVHVDRLHRRGLHEGDSELFGEGFALSVRHRLQRQTQGKCVQVKNMFLNKTIL